MTVNNLMILLFPILDFLPFCIPQYWLFRESLRFSFRTTLLFLIGLAIVNSVAFYLINQGGYEAAASCTTLMRYSFLLFFVALSFVLIRTSFQKNMFILLMMISYSFFIFGNANFIESRWFWAFSDRHPYMVYNLVRIILLAATYPLLFRFLRHTLRDSLAIEDKTVWQYMWKIPLFSTLFGMLYCTVSDVYAFASWQFLISRYLMLLGSCYVSYVLLRILERSKKQIQLEEALRYAGQSLETQRKQYENLSSHMEEVRRARHDLRQHLSVVDGFIERDDREGLREYIRQYRAALPLDTMEIYCRNDVVNGIVCCYGDIARQHRIPFKANIEYPELTSVSDTDAAVLFGNLLENAVEACLHQQQGKKFIRLTVKQAGGGIVIVLDNSFSGKVRQEGEGFLSTKREGIGIGIGSIREIAKKYNGYAEFSSNGKEFSSSVFLNPAG